LRFSCCFRFEPEAPGLIVHVPGMALMDERIDFSGFASTTMRISPEIHFDEL
jgi:hypothetical protein